MTVNARTQERTGAGRSTAPSEPEADASRSRRASRPAFEEFALVGAAVGAVAAGAGGRAGRRLLARGARPSGGSAYGRPGRAAQPGRLRARAGRRRAARGAGGDPARGRRAGDARCCWPRCWRSRRSGSRRRCRRWPRSTPAPAAASSCARSPAGGGSTRGASSPPYVERFVLDGQQIRLTQAALETLAVVAYKQPVTRSRVAAIRGVNCDGVIKTLVTRGLVEECGTRAGERRPPLPHHASCSWRSSASTASRTCRRWRRSCPTTSTRSTLPSADAERRPTTRPAAAAEGARRRRGRLPAGLRGADRRRPGHRGRSAGRRWATGPTRRTSVIHVDGERVVTDTRLVYLALNKPRGIVSTMSDERGRPGIDELLGAEHAAAGLPRRPARRRQRGAAAAHQRRRPGPPADPPVVRRGRRPTWPRWPGRSRAGSAGALQAGVELEDGPAGGRRVPAGRLDAPDRAGGDHPARGTQAHRAADARRGRAPGGPARPHRGRARSSSATCARGGGGTSPGPRWPRCSPPPTTCRPTPGASRVPGVRDRAGQSSGLGCVRV